MRSYCSALVLSARIESDFSTITYSDSNHKVVSLEPRAQLSQVPVVNA